MENDIAYFNKWSYTSIGGFLEWCPSNSYFFNDSLRNDILLHSDLSNQRVLIGTDCNDVSAFNVQSAQLEISRNTVSHCNIYVGSDRPSDYSEAFVCGLGNAKFYSNVSISNYLGIGTSNNTHRLTILGPSNDIFSGPNTICYFNTTSDPVFQHLNWGHDAIFQAFDNYYDQGWMSSSSNGNFLIGKSPNQLNFYAASNVDVGYDATDIFKVGLSIHDNTYVGVGNSIPEGQLDIHGTSFMRGDTTIVNSTFNVSNIIGNVPMYTVGNTLDVFGRCFVSGGLEVGNDGSMLFVTPDNAYNTSLWKMTNTGNVYITDSNVGIFTSNPQYPLEVNGNMHVAGYITSLSDARLKKNISALSNCLDGLCKLTGYSYELSNSVTQTRHFGLMAQEVENVFPELVDYDIKYDKYSVKYCNMIAVLVESIKDLKREIELLRNKKEE